MYFSTDGENIIAEGILTPYDASQLVLSINEMKAKKPGKKVTLMINSPGGDITAGLAVAQLINYQAKDVIVIGFGAISSAATFVAAMAERFYIYENSTILIHPARRIPSNPVSMDDAEQMRIDLERIQNNLADMYSKKLQANNKLINNSFDETKQHFVNLMKKDSYLTDKQALELGLVDGIIPQNGSKIIKSAGSSATDTNNGNVNVEYEQIIRNVQKDVNKYVPHEEVCTGYQNIAVLLDPKDLVNFQKTFINQKEKPKMSFFQKLKTAFGMATEDELKEMGLQKTTTENSAAEAEDEKKAAAEAEKKAAAEAQKKADELAKQKAEELAKQKNDQNLDIAAMQKRLEELEKSAKDKEVALKKEADENLKKVQDALDEKEKQLKLKEAELANLNKPSAQNINNGQQGSDQSKAEAEYSNLMQQTLAAVAKDLTK